MKRGLTGCHLQDKVISVTGMIMERQVKNNCGRVQKQPTHSGGTQKCEEHHIAGLA
jgi:hypothetical protein